MLVETPKSQKNTDFHKHMYFPGVDSTLPLWGGCHCVEEQAFIENTARGRTGCHENQPD